MKTNSSPAKPEKLSTRRPNTPVDLAGLKKQIATLSVSAKQEVFDYLLLLRQETKTTSSKERHLLMWTASLNYELGKMLGSKNKIFPQVYLSQAKKFLKEVDDFLDLADLGDLNTEDLKRMHNLLAKVLVSHASIISARAKIPLSMKLVLQTTMPLVAIFDNHFPGYVKARLVKKILLAVGTGINFSNDGDDD